MLELSRGTYPNGLEKDMPQHRGAESDLLDTDSNAVPSASEMRAADVQLAKLVRTIEAEIIPRLMLAHNDARRAKLTQRQAERWPNFEHVKEFAQLVRGEGAFEALRYVEALRTQGFQLENLYLALIGGAARYLGDLWEDDLCDFVEVTLALGRMQQVLQELSPEFVGDAETSGRELKILLAPAPGEQHSLGLSMVKEFFLRDGWNVCASPRNSGDELPRTVGEEWFDAVGLSVACDCAPERLAALIRSIRLESLNRRIVVLVGGPIFHSHPEYAERVGADAMPADAREGVVQARLLVADKARVTADRDFFGVKVT